jgi:hypothetical protein
MSDTINWMRLWMLGVVVACSGDPTLEVEVTHPPSLMVASTTVTVYESATLTCEDVELARLDSNALEALAVTAETIDANGKATGALTGISRTDNKVIVARGYDNKQQLLAAGCVQKGEITGNDTVSITTLVVAIVSLKPPIGVADNTVTITLTDPSGLSIADARPVSWTVYGPAGSVAANAQNTTASDDGVWEPTLPTCSSNGVAKLHPNPPSTVGGYAVQVRAAWARQQPPLYTSLTSADFTFLMPAGYTPAPIRAFCAIRIKGTTRRLACLDNANTAHDYAVVVMDGRAAALQDMGTQSNVIGGGNALDLLSVPASGSSADRDVYAVSDRGQLTALFGAPPPTNDPIPPCAACTDVLVVPPCGPIPGKLLLSVPIAVSANMKQLDARGGNAQIIAVSGVLESRPDNAGCVTELVPSSTPVLGQFASFHSGAGAGNNFVAATTHLLACTSSTCTESMLELTKGAGVGFTGGGEPRLIATSVDATGVVLVQSVFSPAGGPIERSRMAAASIPDRVVVGQLDKDTDTDVLWDISSRQGTSFEVAYGRTVGSTGQALEALDPAQSPDVLSMQTGDLDGNGFDDLVVLSAPGIAIVPAGIPTAPTPANSDPTCAP